MQSTHVYTLLLQGVFTLMQAVIICVNYYLCPLAYKSWWETCCRSSSRPRCLDDREWLSHQSCCSYNGSKLNLTSFYLLQLQF